MGQNAIHCPISFLWTSKPGNYTTKFPKIKVRAVRGENNASDCFTTFPSQNSCVDIHVSKSTWENRWLQSNHCCVLYLHILHRRDDLMGKFLHCLLSVHRTPWLTSHFRCKSCFDKKEPNLLKLAGFSHVSNACVSLHLCYGLKKTA